MDHKIGIIISATKNLTGRKLDRVLKKSRRVLDFLTSISDERINQAFAGQEIEISNPRDIRDTVEKYLKEENKEKQKDLLSLIYFQLKNVVESGIDKTLIYEFFQEIIHVEFHDGCDRMNLYEFVTNSYDRSVRWYALECVFLSKMCQPWARYISYPLLDVQKPKTNQRIRNVYRVFHLLYDIQHRIPEGCEYKIGIPPITRMTNQFLKVPSSKKSV